MTISIIIPTRNRSQLLDACLHSLVRQTQKPSEVIIIDNNSTDSTKDVIAKYQAKLPIKICHTKKKGYPKLYNEGIKRATKDIVCFLDDDCTADRNWLKQAVTAQKKHPNSILQGMSYSVPQDNLYAQIMGNHYQNWLTAHTLPSGEMLLFDNKNLAGPRKIFQRHFFSEDMYQGAEDIELSKRLRKRGITIFFKPTMVVFHNERTHFSSFISQHFRIARGEKMLDRKVSSSDRVGGFMTKKSWLNLLSFLQKEHELIAKKHFLSAIKLVGIYITLAVIRIKGYFF